ncbi:MAG: aminomethyl-transferring glycine dehydrogenase [Planctomycetota bacterium]|nr:aminomethyl-transferring glycine dehydrogenase [Planctomycetota bacterium]
MTDPSSTARTPFEPTDRFVDRHIGPDRREIAEMLATVGYEDIESLMNAAIPGSLRYRDELRLDAPATSHGLSEAEALEAIRRMCDENQCWKSHIGMGYHGTITPAVILRNIVENPCWYTQYTPYQAEISQGRLEALLNFQTMISDLTGLPICGASLLDESTAAAEAMGMCLAQHRGTRCDFFVSDQCHPQTIEVIMTRAPGLGAKVTVGDVADFDPEGGNWAGVLVQYPATDGSIEDFSGLAESAARHKTLVVAAADPMSLCLLKPPGEWGADIAVGSTQRFGVPMGYGGPHAAYLACKQPLVRKMPGRLIGVSRDAQGKTALRMAIQTREQHIRRDKATSNICTAQVLLAIVASMYGVYHGPDGLEAIASRIHRMTCALAECLRRLGHSTGDGSFFDTLKVGLGAGMTGEQVLEAAARERINLRHFAGEDAFGITLDETTRLEDLECLVRVFTPRGETDLPNPGELADQEHRLGSNERKTGYMTHPVFNEHRSETELLRYAKRLQSRDLSLADSMIPLGSCTMKLNAAAEMLPVTWHGFADLHPFAPVEQAQGYARLFEQLEGWLAEITGFRAVSLQPNAGSQGEYAGLMVIKALHESRGDTARTKCVIPMSAHGTNPASAVIAGMEVVPVNCCEETGDIDLADLRNRIEECGEQLAAIMVTYPSTHGVFEEGIRELCDLVHDAGGLVYMDGANMTAQVGLTRPGDLGADVCHLNLHKTFCIPHGGGGPGMGPIGVTEELAPFLPTHPVVAPRSAGDTPIGAISAAPYGSPMILPISWMYIACMGSRGLRQASEIAILNANSMAKRLGDSFDILFTNQNGCCAHEFIMDCRGFEKTAGIRIDDIAKRLMDYGFHAPTMSWPVAGTLMVEPTESESLEELDRYCDALISIRAEIREIEEGRADPEDNLLKNAPHTMEMVGSEQWEHPYPRSQAAWPVEWLKQGKFWAHVGRVDNPFGDRNLVCSCEGMQAHGEE